MRYKILLIILCSLLLIGIVYAGGTLIQKQLELSKEQIAGLNAINISGVVVSELNCTSKSCDYTITPSNCRVGESCYWVQNMNIDYTSNDTALQNNVDAQVKHYLIMLSGISDASKSQATKLNPTQITFKEATT